MTILFKIPNPVTLGTTRFQKNEFLKISENTQKRLKGEQNG